MLRQLISSAGMKVAIFVPSNIYVSLAGRSLTGSPARAARAGCAVEQGGRERASSGGDRDMQNARRSTQLTYQSSHGVGAMSGNEDVAIVHGVTVLYHAS